MKIRKHTIAKTLFILLFTLGPIQKSPLPVRLPMPCEAIQITDCEGRVYKIRKEAMNFTTEELYEWMDEKNSCTDNAGLN